MIHLNDVDAIEARAVLKRLGLKHMEGSNNRRGEWWLPETGPPFFVPYGRNVPNTFVKEVFDEIVNKLT